MTSSRRLIFNEAIENIICRDIAKRYIMKLCDAHEFFKFIINCKNISNNELWSEFLNNFGRDSFERWKFETQLDEEFVKLSKIEKEICENHD